jgi:8-oxo-dGTP pyrophosphatase MutT (NUDIX family)
LNFPCKTAFIHFMADIPLVPLERLDLRFTPRAWAFAAERRAEIDRHFADMRRGKPEMWNGRVLVLHEFAITDGVLRGAYLETDFASFLAWRDWGFPDKSVRNCFAMGALRATDGAFVLGIMGDHTANAGKIYFFGGTPEPQDIVDGRVDLESSVLRELHEETGVSPDLVDPEPGWCAIFDGGRIALVKVLRAAEPAAALRARILAFLSREQIPELAGVQMVRGPADFDSRMPPFVPNFFDHIWATAPDRRAAAAHR